VICMIIKKCGNMVDLYYLADRTYVCAGYNIRAVRLWTENSMLPVATLFDGEMYIDETDIVNINYNANDIGHVYLNITLRVW